MLKILVLCSFSVLTDITQQLASPEFTVTSLIEANQDFHGFEPTPHHAKQISQAQVIIVNGLGLDTTVERLAASLNPKASVGVAAQGIPLLVKNDPHAYLSFANLKQYAKNIAQLLIQVAPQTKPQIESNLKKYLSEIQVVEQNLKKTLLPIKENTETIFVSSHPSLQYMAQELSLPILAISSHAHGHGLASELKAQLHKIKKYKNKVFLLAASENPRLLEQMAKDVQGQLKSGIYVDYLSPSSGPAPTTLQMIQTNAEIMKQALKP